MERSKHYWLYVLKLKAGKYYVGITTKTPEIRFKEHAQGFAGAAWTRKYKPLKIIDSKDLGVINESRAQSYENKVVRVYIKKYGIDNVRGGNISISEDLVTKFGWWWLKKDWETLTSVMLLLLIIAVLSISILLTR